jgi:hypothetical protein
MPDMRVATVLCGLGMDIGVSLVLGAPFFAVLFRSSGA